MGRGGMECGASEGLSCPSLASKRDSARASPPRYEYISDVLPDWPG